MRKTVYGLLTLACSVALMGGATAQTPAKEPAKEVWTAVSISDLDCENCAGKICKEIEKQAGVAKTQTDMKTKTIYVLAKGGADLSGKALWEAVEKFEKTPSKLVGPGGTFTAKPKS